MEVELEWKVAQEDNFLGYELERSFDALNFEKRTFVKAINAITYTSVDDFPASHTEVYCRLKLIDLDGATSYSEVLVAKRIADAVEIFAFPNPTYSILNVEWSNEVKYALMHLELINTKGEIVSKKILNSSQNKTELDLSSLPSGNYYLTVYNQKVLLTKELIIIK